MALVTLYRTTTADGLKIRLVERAVKPRFVIITGTKVMAGFHPIGNDIDDAVLTYIKHVERAQNTVNLTRIA